jgi:hypothetical protein
VQTGIRADRLQRSGTETYLLLVWVLVEDGGLDLVKVENEFFRDDVLDGRSERDIVVACQGGEGRVRAWALGEQLFGGCLGRGRVLGNGGLDAFYCEPVG